MVTLLISFLPVVAFAGPMLHVECRSTNGSNVLQVSAAWTDEALSVGHIVITDINGFPPVTLVNQPFESLATQWTRVLISEKDGDFHYQAEMEIPADVPKGPFKGRLNIHRKYSPPIKAVLDCQKQ